MKKVEHDRVIEDAVRHTTSLLFSAFQGECLQFGESVFTRYVHTNISDPNIPLTRIHAACDTMTSGIPGFDSAKAGEHMIEALKNDPDGVLKEYLKHQKFSSSWIDSMPLVYSGQDLPKFQKRPDFVFDVDEIKLQALKKPITNLVQRVGSSLSFE